MTRKIRKETKAQMRVKVAKDVISQIKAKKIKAQAGVYIDSPELEKQFNSQEQNVKAPKKRCEACALGSCMISALRLYNSFSFTDEDKYLHSDLRSAREILTQYLERWFSPSQLDSIEWAFEHTPNQVEEYRMFGNTPSAAQKFGAQYKKDNDRLVAIMENIIKNKGTFKPRITK